MAEIKGLVDLMKKLQQRVDRAKLDSATGVKVGFSTAYAVHVHEDLEAHHQVGQAKFLEEPARLNRSAYALIIAEQAKKGRSLGQALMVAGLQLQRDAQELCPVDKDVLRASAFTEVVVDQRPDAT